LQPLFQNRAPEYFYGLVLLRTGNTSEAIRELERVTKWFPLLWNVVNIFPTNMYWPVASVKARYWLGVAHEEQGDLGRSVKEYQKFLAIWKDADFDSPEITDAKVRLQKLYKTAGK
jgi:tetratricopeptide (TPR) repeat protein